MTPVLDISGMRITSGSDPEVQFRLDVPSFVLWPGSRIALVGPSGCGKSSLLEVLALLRPPQQAERFHLCLEESQSALRLEQGGEHSVLRQQPIGYVPQSGGILPFLTAQAHVDSALHLAGQGSSAQARLRLEHFVTMLKLTGHMGKRRSALSGGQRKRVALLTGFAVPRRLLIADEPTAGLDAAAAARVLDCLVAVADSEKTAVVIATHDVAAARQAGFDLAFIAEGALQVRPSRGALVAAEPVHV